MKALFYWAWGGIKRSTFWRNSTFWIAAATVAVAVFNFFLMYYSGQQLSSMRDQLKTADASANAARDAADTARDALKSSNRSSEQSERAYMYVKPGPLHCIMDKCRLESYTLLGNSGKTYAKDVEYFSGVIVRPRLTTDQEANLGPGVREEGVTVIGPSVERAFMRRGEQMTAEKVEEVRTGKERVYVFGEIR